MKPFRKIAAFLIAWNFKSSSFVTKITDKILRADAFKNGVSKWVENSWGEKINSATEALDVSSAERYEGTFGIVGEVFKNIKEYCYSLYENMFLGGSGSDGMTMQEKIEAFTEEVITYVSEGVLKFISSLLGFIIIYILVSLGFWLMIKLLDKMFKKGFFGFVNRVTGGIVGIGIGFLVAWVLAILFVNVLPIVLPIEKELVLSGQLGVVKWFYTSFLLSAFFGFSG